MNIKFYIPVTDLQKSEKNELKNKEGILGKIRGLASTPDLDYAGEQVVQKGLDIASFIKNGFLNWDHDNSIIVGYPDKEGTKLTKDGLMVEGYILDTPEGRKVRDAANALEKSSAERNLGFSIEGQVLKSDKKGRILQARVTNVAITPTPCNPYATWATVAKSLTVNNADESTNALVRESLENAKIYCQRGLDGDIEVLDSLNTLKDKIDRKGDRDDVRLYLMMFEGLYADKLEDTTREILDYEEKE